MRTGFRILGVALPLAIAALPASARNTFQDTCSEIRFAYTEQGEATIAAMCLRADGMPHATAVVLQGITNQDGRLTQGTGASTFQKSCGSIQVTIDDAKVTLTARCRRWDGSVIPASLPLDHLHDNNGVLIQEKTQWDP